MRQLLIAASAVLAFAPGITTHADAQSPAQSPAQSSDTLTVSMTSSSRELNTQTNAAFIPRWTAKTGQNITIKQSLGGSSAQARAILGGLEADVVTFNLVPDVQVLHDKGNLIPADWQKRFPNNASPYYSLPAFLVRGGNPKNIKDWDDLIRPDVKLIFPNPKTSGNSVYTYLAAYAYARHKYGSDAAADDFIRKLFANVVAFDSGGSVAAATFVDHQTGDVLLAFETEADAIRAKSGADKYQVVVPSVSLLAEFPVTVVDTYVDKHGTRDLATAYLDFLYTSEGQEIAAKAYNRVNDPTVAVKYKDQFPDVKLLRVEDEFGGWDKLEADHLKPGAKLDQLFGNR